MQEKFEMLNLTAFSHWAQEMKGGVSNAETQDDIKNITIQAI